MSKTLVFEHRQNSIRNSEVYGGVGDFANFYDWTCSCCPAWACRGSLYSKTLYHGLSAGLVSGLGAATADALYGGAAVFGVAAVSALFFRFHLLLEFFGGLFLFFIGIALLSAPLRFPAKRIKSFQGSDYFSAFILALTNPTLILSFGAIFALFRLIELRHIFFALMLMLGIFLGFMLWWIILCSALRKLHGKLGDLWIARINSIVGSLLIIFAMIALGNVAKILIHLYARYRHSFSNLGLIPLSLLQGQRNFRQFLYVRIENFRL